MGWRDKLKKKLKKIGKVVEDTAKVAVAPAKVVVDIAKGDSPKEAIEGIVEDAKDLVTATEQAANAPYDVAIKIGDAVAGDTGKSIVEFSTMTNRIATKIVAQSAKAFGEILTGNNPLEHFAIPLAAAIAAARDTFDSEAKPLPSELLRMLAGHFTPTQLQRARFVKDRLTITLPTVINGSQTFYGKDNHAVVVDDIIVFHEIPAFDANGVEFWAHEIHHVVQYMNYGVNRFAFKYITDFDGIEDEAEGVGKDVRTALFPS